MERVQSPGEEIANSVGNWPVAGASAFAATTLLLYLASTIYHALPRNRTKRRFRLLDHMAIFLLIAGTYTPFTLGALRGAVG